MNLKYDILEITRESDRCEKKDIRGWIDTSVNDSSLYLEIVYIIKK